MVGKQEDTKTVATKINRESYSLFSSIAKKANLTVYTLLQVVIDCYLRYVSDEVEITDSMDKIVNGFANFSIAKDSFCICASESNQELQSFIAFIQKKGSNFPQAVLFKKKDEESVSKCYRYDDMLILFLSSISPSLITALSEIKAKENLLSLTDAMKFAINEQTNPTKIDISTEIKGFFSDNSRSEYGKRIDYSECGSYKRINNCYKDLDK